MNYYNEHDKYAAQWLRNLIDAGHLPAGVVDDRDMQRIAASDLDGFTQCHFFAGIGGWPLALRLAGWPDDKPIWTGSCPCQPFSVAGKQVGIADERHLWPVFAELIRACRPATVFGEQVASKAGREWLAGVFTDLEGMGYQRAGADLCAASVGAPHIRQRLFWVADAEIGGQPMQWRAPQPGSEGHPDGCISDCGLGDAIEPGLEGLAGHGDHEDEPGRHGAQPRGSIAEACGAGFWSAHNLIPCADGKSRRIEPGAFPLAHGIPARVGKLRAYGNAIVPQVAVEFIGAFLDEKGTLDKG